MKQGELEKILEDRAKHITDSKLIEKCYNVCGRLGVITKSEGRNHSASHEYTDESLRVQSYANDFNNYIHVHWKGQCVLDTSGGYADGKSDGKFYVIVDNRKIATYKPGEWEHRITKLYDGINKDVPKEQLDDVADRYGIDVPKKTP